MLDLDFGTFPYVTSSTTTAGGIATGLGLYVVPSPRRCERVAPHSLRGLPNQRAKQAGLRHGCGEGIHHSCRRRAVPNR